MRKESGFTLIELMVAITIVSIIVAIAVPSWNRWIPSYRLKRATRDVFSSFQQAKLEAVRRNVNVILIFDLGNQKYDMYVDDDGNFDNNEPMLGTLQMPGKVTLVSANFSGGTQQAGFDSRGLPAASRWGTVTLNNTKGISRNIILSPAGNIRIQ